MEHTSGPWKVGTHDKVINYLPIYARIGVTKLVCIAKTDGHEVGFGIAQAEMEANARLIAAAPDLLRGCLAALAYLADPPSPFASNRKDAINIIKAAIAKAEGRE